jgi:hypothetical protein
MAYRGRLLRPLVVEIAQLDTNATELAEGYDPVWRTPKTTYPGGVRTKGQQYKPSIRLRAQVEPASEAAQQRTVAGDVPDSKMVLVFHYIDLAALNLVDENGHPKIRVNDKLLAVYTRGAVLIKRLIPELFATEVLDTGLGLGGDRNLAAVTFEDRPQGMTT